MSYHFHFCQIDLEDVSEYSISLKIPRKSNFHILDYPVVIKDYKMIDRVNELWLMSYISSEQVNEEQAMSQAYINIKLVLRILSFLYEINLSRLLDGFKLIPRNQEYKKYIDMQTVANSNKNLKKIYEFNSLMESLKNTDISRWNNGIEAIKFYAKAHELLDHELEEESFFSAYKALELVSNFVYNKHYKINIDKQIENIVPMFIKDYFEEEYNKAGNDKDATNYTIVAIFREFCLTPL